MNNKDFYNKVFSNILISLSNYYEDNYDYLRFGSINKKQRLKDYIKNKILKNNYISKYSFNILANTLEQYGEKFSWLYENLNNVESKKLLVELITYLILGYRHVKLPINNEDYWSKIKSLEKLAIKNDKLNSGFLNWDLWLFDLKNIGYDIKLYFTTLGTNIDFILEQYSYKSKEIVIEAKPGDYVIDAGGCWGDTSLYFASKIGASGKVFSFEFIPQNITIFEKNLSLNPVLSNQIRIVKRPLWDANERKVYYIDNGTASRVSFDKLENYDGETSTITIDTFVEENKIEKVDFIKMDIEGAESFALNGAVNTIKKFRPKLAIAIYHSLDDFSTIPRWISDLKLSYKLYVGHYTIHSEETVIFATTE